MAHIGVLYGSCIRCRVGLGLRIYSVGLGSRVGSRFPVVLGLEVPRS